MATVLIVDDDKFTRTALERILSQDASFADFEVKVVTAADGSEGLLAFHDHEPDVVIVDLLMPKRDGFSLCQAIRAEADGDGPELIVISGIYRDSAIAVRVRKEYNATFFVKPYQLKQMTEHVADWLADQHGEKTIAAPSPITNDEPSAPVIEATTDEGDLSTRPLAAVLLDLLDSHATGNLVIRRARVTKTIGLLFGHPVSARSSVRDETLGHFLVARNVITDVDHATAIRTASATGKRMGEALIEMGVLNPEELVDHLSEQVRHKVIQSLRWPDGAWSFQPTADIANAPANSSIDTLRLLCTGLSQTAFMDKVPEDITGLGSAPLQLTPRGVELLPALRHHLNNNFADVWTDGTTVSALLASAIGRDAVLVALDCLLQTGGIIAAESEDIEMPSMFHDEESSISVEALSERSRVTKLPGAAPKEDAQLYSMLFEEGDQVTPPTTGDIPLEVPDEDAVPGAANMPDSGYIDVQDISSAKEKSKESRELDSARRMLLAEFLRVQGGDHYVALKVDPSAEEAEISAAIVERRSKFSLDWFSRFDLGRDYAKLEQIHAAYERANETLMDAEKRRLFDLERTGGDLPETAPTLDAEIAFRAAEEYLQRGQFGQALERLQRAVQDAPEEATYHATLGWTLFLKGDRTARAADEARTSLNQALAINPDHARAHECKGIITAELGDDDAEAQFHLELALNADPNRKEALSRLEAIWTRRGKFRPLERLYKKLIYKAAGGDPKVEQKLWTKLAELYRNELDDDEAARIAYKSAVRLAPDDQAIQAALADLTSGSPDRFHERSEMLRTHWRNDPASAGPGMELLRAAQQAARPDAVFLAASALVARGVDNEEARELYERYRPRFVIRAHRQLLGDFWQQICHPDDSAEITRIFALITPAIQRVMPLTLMDLEIDDTMLVDPDVLPPGMIHMFEYIAHMLGVAVPPLYVRPDFGHQIHLAAVNPPVLLAGDEALAAPERAELCFRLGRAMTYLVAGRSLGGAQPARILKQAILAAFSAANPSAPIDDPEGLIGEFREAMEYLPDEAQRTVHTLVTSLTEASQSLNLSRWSKALARTADRVGLLLCGDLPAAVRFASDSAGEETHLDLVDFGVSSQHLQLRTALGLSIDV